MYTIIKKASTFVVFLACWPLQVMEVLVPAPDVFTLLLSTDTVRDRIQQFVDCISFLYANKGTNRLLLQRQRCLSLSSHRRVVERTARSALNGYACPRVDKGPDSASCLNVYAILDLDLVVRALQEAGIKIQVLRLLLVQFISNLQRFASLSNLHTLYMKQRLEMSRDGYNGHRYEGQRPMEPTIFLGNP